MSAGRAHSAAHGEGCNQQRHGCGPADSLCTGAFLLLTGLLPPRSRVSGCQHVAYILLSLSRSGASDAVSICTLEQIMMLLKCHKLVSVHAGDPHKRQAGGPSSLQGKARACLSRDVKCKQVFHALFTGSALCCCPGNWRQGWLLVSYICTQRAVASSVWGAVNFTLSPHTSFLAFFASSSKSRVGTDFVTSK